MNKKILCVLTALIITCVLAVPAFAEETVPADTPDNTVQSSAYETFVSKINAYAATGYDVKLTYTSDSVRARGMLLESYIDSVKLETGFVLRSDLDIGIRVYDDPSTEIIDGIRVNGAEVTSYAIPFDLDAPQNYIVEVRLEYTDDVFGTYAKIADGKLDLETVLNEPAIYLKGVYYLIAAISLIVGGIGAAVSKAKKVKTTNEIAATVDARVQEGCEAFAILYSEVLKENLLPVFQSMVDTNKSVVKAITLSTSKTKEAPIALLDTLKEVSDVNVEKAIEDARIAVLKNIADADTKRAALHSILNHIADGTYQEVQNVETISKSERAETVSETTETKSVF